jgi:HlyD family secretion protein
MLLPRGNFYQKTGGQWIFVVAEDGKSAEKRFIKIGRQNPNFYELLEGIDPGEKVIVSGYDGFGENEKLKW